MIQRFAQVTSRRDPGVPVEPLAYVDHAAFAAPQRDLLATLSAACCEDPRDAWNAVGRTACLACAANAGGVVMNAFHDQRGVAGDATLLDDTICATLVTLLHHSPKCAAWTDARTGINYAAASIGPDPAAGFIWVRREQDDFVWIEALHLRALSSFAMLLRSLEQRIEESELLLLEHRHRCSNDLQLVNSLLAFQARQSDDPTVSGALESAAARISALAAARGASPAALPMMLRQFCEALAVQVEQRGVAVDVAIDGEPCALDDRQTTVVLIAANELVTNAIKHAFPESRSGSIKVALEYRPAMLRLSVSDDGIPLPPTAQMLSSGSGFSLLSQLLSGARGKLGMPPGLTKTFVIEMPQQ